MTIRDEIHTVSYPHLCDTSVRLGDDGAQLMVPVHPERLITLNNSFSN